MPKPPVPPDKIGPDDPRYRDLVRRGFNKRFAGKPDYVRVVSSTEQVVDAVQDAVRDALRLAVRSGAHCLEGFVADPAVRVLIDTSLMTGVYHDPEMAAFAVEAGTTLGEAYRKLFLGWGGAIPAGESPDIGMGGHVSGGAFGFLCREHGLAADYLYGVEVVVVDEAGTARTVVATRAPSDPNRDLWWAHTGGGPGNFGVVTRCWFRSPDASGTDTGSLLPKAPDSVLTFRGGLELGRHGRGGFHQAGAQPRRLVRAQQRAGFSLRPAVQHPLSPSPPVRQARAEGAVDRRGRGRAAVRRAPGRNQRGQTRRTKSGAWPGFARSTGTCLPPTAAYPCPARSATGPSSTIPTSTSPTRSGTLPGSPGIRCTTRTTTPTAADQVPLGSLQRVPPRPIHPTRVTERLPRLSAGALVTFRTDLLYV